MIYLLLHINPDAATEWIYLTMVIPGANELLTCRMVHMKES